MNSYTGGTTISANTTLQGTSNSLQGAIAGAGATSIVNFNQNFNGTSVALIGGAGTPVNYLGTGTVTIPAVGAGGALSSYTGATTISGGVLAVNKLANGGSNSNLGASSNAATSLLINGGTLQYLGAGDATDRTFTIGANGATLDGSGTGALNLTSRLRPRSRAALATL